MKRLTHERKYTTLTNINKQRTTYVIDIDLIRHLINKRKHAHFNLTQHVIILVKLKHMLT